jgi:hypothetical protein
MQAFELQQSPLDDSDSSSSFQQLTVYAFFPLLT